MPWIPLTDKSVIASLLNCFANNGYNITKAAKCNSMSYNKARWYINKYYTRMQLTESTEIRIFKSKV